MNKIVIITGLTASGKSGLAMDIASKYNGEIISADSVQIYRGLDIGSAKESIENREKIRHHLIDIVNFDDSYNVGQFVCDCQKSILDIMSRNKLPIIVGGTGLYIKSLLEGYSLGSTPADIKFRTELESLAKVYGNIYVWNMLNAINPSKAKTVHFNNLKRVIRYLEIEKFGNIESKEKSILADFNVLALGIIDDRESIYARINERVDKMIISGLEQEVRDLINNGATKDMQSMTSIGYKEWFDYSSGLTNLEDTITLIKQHSRNYCKRQLTFLKTIKGVELLTLNQAKDRIEEFLC